MVSDEPQEGGDYEANLRPYFEAIGKVAVAWNRMQDSMGLLFITLFVPGSTAEPLAVWHEIKSDRTQRQILKAAAATHFAKDSDNARRFPLALQYIMYLANEVEKIEDQRNNALHAPLGVGIDSSEKKFAMVAWTMLENPRALRLRDKNLLAEFEWYRAKLDMLSGYCHHVQAMLMAFDDWPHAWPETPQLPALDLSRKAE